MWTFVGIALIVPILWLWESTTNPPEHVVYYAIEVALLWAVLLLIMSPMTKMRERKVESSAPTT